MILEPSFSFAVFHTEISSTTELIQAESYHN